MAKLSKAEVEEIIARDLPDYQVAKESLEHEEESDVARLRDSRQGAISDATSPDLDTLREKLRQQSPSADTTDATANEGPSLREGRSWSFLEDGTTVEDEPADDVIVAVKPKKSHSPFDAGYRTKAVVISGRSKRVIGRQG
jgi:hypothetical protein